MSSMKPPSKPAPFVEGDHNHDDHDVVVVDDALKVVMMISWWREWKGCGSGCRRFLVGMNEASDRMAEIRDIPPNASLRGPL